MTDAKVARYAKGRRPDFFADPAMDEAMSMIMVLCSELSVMRDRLDVFEAIVAEKGVMTAEEIDAYQPSQAMLEAREERRQDFFARLFFVANKRATELAADDTQARYAAVLEETAEG